MSEPSVFYRAWIVANGWAEGVGLGATFILGGLAAPAIEAEPNPGTIIAGAFSAVVVGTLLEGVLVGFAQGRVLQRRLPALQLKSWVTATAIGAGLAWLAGMVPSTVMALSSLGEEGIAPPEEPPQLVILALAIVMGLATGPILGAAQWRVLRRHVDHARRWLWANALAWAAGMFVIFAGMDYVPWNGAPASRALALCAVCAAAGLAVGAVHGRVLIQLTGSPRPPVA